MNPVPTSPLADDMQQNTLQINILYVKILNICKYYIYHHKKEMEQLQMQYRFIHQENLELLPIKEDKKLLFTSAFTILVF